MFKKILIFLMFLLIAGSPQAKADFSGDFAPENWVYTENDDSVDGPSGTLTSSEMQLTGSDNGEEGSIGMYSVVLPNGVGTITFTYTYTTYDVDGSGLDRAFYTVNGTTTYLPTSELNEGETEIGSVVINLVGLDGTTLSIGQSCSDCVFGRGEISISEFIAILKSSHNLLRLDAAATVTEKNNVVSCSPGKYTFLDSGATAEAAKIQSFVYTLLVNGKAVSTLSTDNFATVDSSLFPTLTGGPTGTATVEGATWDLKGMSNYSAQCQIYATQSGAALQTTTTAVYDVVALTAQAEAAAAAQKVKDMIANWASANEELAKKYRDNRLAGKG